MGFSTISSFLKKKKENEEPSTSQVQPLSSGTQSTEDSMREAFGKDKRKRDEDDEEDEGYGR